MVSFRVKSGRRWIIISVFPVQVLFPLTFLLHPAYNPLMEGVSEYLKRIDYPGRVVIAGLDPHGVPFVLYAITGRSQNSRNRILVHDGDTVRTEAYDESLVSDPSLIIYNAIMKCNGWLVASNGDHTDTITDCLLRGGNFAEAVAKRTYEPDAPSFTPRIAALVSPDGVVSFSSIIREECGVPLRRIWDFPCENGVCHIIHTYISDGNPLPSFREKPVRLSASDCNGFLEDVWASLAEKYRVAACMACDDDIRIINALEEHNGKA